MDFRLPSSTGSGGDSAGPERLESGWAVVSVTDRLATIRDGVKVSTLACACPFFSDYPPSVYSRTPTPPHSSFAPPPTLCVG